MAPCVVVRVKPCCDQLAAILNQSAMAMLWPLLWAMPLLRLMRINGDPAHRLPFLPRFWRDLSERPALGIQLCPDDGRDLLFFVHVGVLVSSFRSAERASMNSRAVSGLLSRLKAVSAVSSLRLADSSGGGEDSGRVNRLSVMGGGWLFNEKELFDFDAGSSGLARILVSLHKHLMRDL